MIMEVFFHENNSVRKHLSNVRNSIKEDIEKRHIIHYRRKVNHPLLFPTVFLEAKEKKENTFR